MTQMAARPRHRRPWLRLFLTGLILWILTVVVTFATGNPNLIPTLVLLGSFLVPVTFVVWAFTGRLLLSYLGVSVLHALWDGMHSSALLITLVLTGTRYQFALLDRGYEPQPTGTQADLFTVLSWGGLIVISLIGIGWLLAVRRRADREARTWWRVPAYR